MGFGIIAKAKMLAPMSVYVAGIVAALLAVGGRYRWAVLLIILLAPLRNVIDKLQMFPLGDQFLDILFASSLVGWMLSSLAQRKPLAEKTSINAASAVLMVYVFFSLIVGSLYLHSYSLIDPGDYRVQSAKNFCMMPILFFLTLNGIENKLWIRRTFMVMCFSMLIMDYYTLAQIRYFPSIESRTKIHGTFQFLGPNEVAAFYNTISVVMISVYFYMKRGWQKLALLGLFLMNMVCMIFMYSRAAYGATAIGLGILFSMKKRIFLIPLLLAVLCWHVVLPEKAVERIEGTVNVYGEYEASAERRFLIWEQAIDLFKENMLFGIGFGSFSRLHLDLGDTHNIYVKIAVEQGIIGLMIFAVLIICFLREGYLLYKKGEDEEGKGLGLGFIVMVFVMLVNCIFGNRWTYFEMNAYVWVVAALAVRFNNLHENPAVPAKAAVRPPTAFTYVHETQEQTTKLKRQKDPKKIKGQKFKRSI